ncbi:MAG: DHHW family protein [Eubacteriales bacterium]|nr:DHHW family protein [Eubacteriales bacterium]
MWYRKKTVYRALLLALTGILAVILVFFGILAVVLPKPTESEAEKRTLASRPAFSWSALFDGSLARDYETFYADTFPFRDGFVRLASRIEDSYGIRYDDVRIVGSTPSDSDDETPARTTAAVTTSAAPDEPDTPSVPDDPVGTSVPTHVAGEPTDPQRPSATTAATTAVTTAAPPEDIEPEKANGVLIYGTRAFEMFGGSENQKYRYAETVSAYADAFPDIDVYNIVVPSSVAFYLPEKYSSYVADEKANIDDIYGALGGNVIAVDAYSVLGQHTAEYIYFNTDHHWTGLGAYYAYTAFAGKAGFTPRAYADYEKRTIEGFTGTLATSTNDAKLLDNPDTVEYCLVPVETTVTRWEKGASSGSSSTVLAEYAKGGNAYGVYLHGDCPRIDIVNDENPGGDVVLVLKESYGNAFAPYLIPHYGKVIVLDERYFTGDLAALVESEGVDEIILINNVFAANTKNTTTRLNALLEG